MMSFFIAEGGGRACNKFLSHTLNTPLPIHNLRLQSHHTVALSTVIKVEALKSYLVRSTSMEWFLVIKMMLSCALEGG